MAVSYVGVSSGNSAGGTSTSFVTTLPAGWAAGDVAVLSGHVRGASLTMGTPAGWTLVPGPAWPVAQASNSRAYAWYRVLQAGDTAPTITNSGAMTGGWSMTVYRGGDTSSPIGQVGTSAVSGTLVALPSLVGVLAGSALAVAVHAGVSTGTIPTDITPDAAYIEVADHATSRATSAANQRMEAGYRLAGSAGSYGGESFGTTVTASMIAVLVEVVAASADLTTSPDGLAVPVVVGAPSANVSLTGSPDGLAVPVALGPPSASWSGQSSPDGITVPAAVGGPGATWSAEATPDGLAVPASVGDPTVDWTTTSTPDGVALPVVLGVPSAQLPGQGVHRPTAAPLARPTSGPVARPAAVAVARPSL